AGAGDLLAGLAAQPPRRGARVNAADGTPPTPGPAPAPGTLPAPRSGVIGLFVDRPVLTLMCVLATVLLGLVSFGKLPLRFMPAGPSVNEISMYVRVPGTMAPQEVQEKVIEPLCELVKTIPGLRKIRSMAGNGGGRVSVGLDEGMDPTLASAEIRDRVQRA